MQHNKNVAQDRQGKTTSRREHKRGTTVTPERVTRQDGPYKTKATKRTDRRQERRHVQRRTSADNEASGYESARGENEVAGEMERE